MKKGRTFIALLIVATLVAMFAGCAQSTPSPAEEENPSEAPAEAPAETPAEAPAEAPAEPIVIKFEHDMAAGTLCDEVWHEIADMVDEKSGGRLQIDIYPSMSLSGGSTPTMYQNLMLGSTGMGQMGSTFSAIVPEIAVFNLPFLVNDIDEMFTLTGDNVLTQALFPLAEEKNIKIISSQTRNLRHFANNKHAITTPEDMVGMTFRVPETIERVEIFKALGTNPVSMSFSDLPMAMSTGAVDGAERPMGNLVEEAWWDLGKYITISGYASDCELIGMNLDLWNSLGDELQGILMECLDWGRQERLDREKEMYDVWLQDLIDNGCEVVVLDKEQKKPFIEKTASVYDQVASRIGWEDIDLALEVLGKDLPPGAGANR